MKHFALLIILTMTFGCATFKTGSKGSYILNGTWVPIKQEIGGKVLPVMVYKTQQLIINDSTYVLTAESVDKGILKYKNGQMDIYGKEGVNSGRHLTALYKMDNGELTICYNLKGDSYPLNFDTKSAPTLFLSVFKKEPSQ